MTRRHGDEIACPPGFEEDPRTPYRPGEQLTALFRRGASRRGRARTCMRSPCPLNACEMASMIRPCRGWAAATSVAGVSGAQNRASSGASRRARVSQHAPLSKASSGAGGLEWCPPRSIAFPALYGWQLRTVADQVFPGAIYRCGHGQCGPFRAEMVRVESRTDAAYNSGGGCRGCGLRFGQRDWLGRDGRWR